MHQLPRASPRSATPASNPATNPERTNNPRDQPPTRTRSSVDLASYTERAGGDPASMASRNEAGAGSSQDRENTKLNQIIQIQSRDGEIRQNRWFNVVIDETDVLSDDLHEWRRPDLYDKPPAPLVVEIYVDSAHLTQNQALVVVDDSGKRFDVSGALSNSADSTPPLTKNGGRLCEVVLERWTVELGDLSGCTSAELNDTLPNVYKKGVVLFRSLYTLLRLLPAWKLYRKLGRQSGNQQALKLKFRIRKGRSLAKSHQDSLFTPLCPSEQQATSTVDKHELAPLLCRAGPLHLSCVVRRGCVFAVASSESLLSDNFSVLDEAVRDPHTAGSLPPPRTAPNRIPPLSAGGRSPPASYGGDHRPHHREPSHSQTQTQPRNRSGSRTRYSSTAVEPPAAPARDRPRALLGAYGSLGTYHVPDRRGSPISDLKQRALEDDLDEMKRLDAIRDEEGATKRASVDYIANPPFKAGSIASTSRPPSPKPSPSPSTSAGRNESYLARYGGHQASSSKRTSLNTLPQQHLRTPSIPNETAIASSASSSPKPPAPVRYSSSFANRPRRLTSQSTKTADSNASSGRGSSDSKDKSGHLNEGSGSARTDDDDIASFISDLEKSSKEVKFHTPPGAGDTIINLAKYSSLRDPTVQLADEMSSSSLIQTSSTPPSRRLSNVPGLSTSSSPSRALAHAPHVRSRLSTHSIVEERSATSASAASGEGSDSPKIREEEDEEEEDLPFIFHHDN